LAIKAVQSSGLTFARIKDSASDIMFKLSQMKFEVLPPYFAFADSYFAILVAVAREGLREE